MADLLPHYKRLVGKAFDRIPEGKIEKGPVVARLTDLMQEKRAMTSGAAMMRKSPGDALHRRHHQESEGRAHQPHALSGFGDGTTRDKLSAHPAFTKCNPPGWTAFPYPRAGLRRRPFGVTGDCVVIMPTGQHRRFSRFRSAVQDQDLLRCSRALPHDPRARPSRLLRPVVASLLLFRWGRAAAGDRAPLEGKFGKEIYEGYGATETCGGVTMSPVDEVRPDRAPSARSCETKRVRSSTNSRRGPTRRGRGADGLIAPHGDAYWKKEEETQEAFLQIDGLVGTAPETW